MTITDQSPFQTYNVGNKSFDRVVADLARLLARDPTVLALNEVGDRDNELAKIVRLTGYRLIRKSHKKSSDHVALLVAPGVVIERVRLITISPRTYVGKNTAGARDNGWAEAKYLLTARLTINGVRWAVGVTHLVPSAMRKGNTRTRALHAAQLAAVVAWLRTRRRNAVVLGDFNADPDHWLMAAARKVCRVYGAPSHGRRSIDLLLCTKRSGLEFSADALDGYSSDHKPVEFRRVELHAHPLAA